MILKINYDNTPMQAQPYAERKHYQIFDDLFY